MASVPTTEVSVPGNPDKVYIESTALPGAYLRSDAEYPSAHGINQLLNIQVTNQGWERHQLVPQDVATWGPNVYVIRSVKWEDFYVHLDPTTFPGQEPAPGTTFHPRGIGRSSLVKGIDGASKFKAVSPQGYEETVAFQLVGVPLEEGIRFVYLRLNISNVTEFEGRGSGEVNGQTYIGPFERLNVKRMP